MGKSLCLLVIVLATFGVGCSPKKENSTTPPPPERVVVRLQPLVQAHYLYPELVRLQKAEQELQRAGREVATPSPLAVALPSVSGNNAPFTRETESAWRSASDAAKETLREEAQRGIMRYEQQERERNNRLEARIREELLAELVARDVAAEQDARRAIDEETVASLRALVDRILVLRAERAVLRAQLGADSVVLAPVVDPEKLEKEIATLQENPATLGIGMRARLELRRRIAAERLTVLEQEFQALIEKGEAAKRLLSQDSEKRRDAEVNRLLAQLREQSADDVVATAEEAAKTTAEDMERISEEGRSQNGGGTGALRVRLGTETNGGKSVPVSSSRAVKDIATLRLDLERWITASVVDTVQDIASSQNRDITFIRTPVEAQAEEVRQRKDVTQEFIRYIMTGVSHAAPGGKQK